MLAAPTAAAGAAVLLLPGAGARRPCFSALHNPDHTQLQVTFQHGGQEHQVPWLSSAWDAELACDALTGKRHVPWLGAVCVLPFVRPCTHSRLMQSLHQHGSANASIPDVLDMNKSAARPSPWLVQ